MPAGIPSREHLTRRVVGAFALDTSVIQGASYGFSDGQLGRLAEQLPPWLHLWLPDIVAREVMRHRMDAVKRAVQQIRSAHTDIRRLLVGAETPQLSDPSSVIQRASCLFDDQLQAFLETHNGKLLEVQSLNVARTIFDRYFSERPPFGGGKDKKHEFPDAACLLMLEAEARARELKVIAVSADNGWKAFADSSDHLYCISSLADLAKLFVATSDKMRTFAQSVVKLIATPAFQRDVKALLTRRLALLPWHTQAWGTGYHVDSGVIDAKLIRFEIREHSLKLWTTAADESACVAEVAVEVEARLDVEAYAYRAKYKSEEKDDLARTNLVVDQGFEITLALEFLDLFPGIAPELALSQLSLVEKPLPVKLGRVQFPGVEISKAGSYFDDSEDDIPF